jgi:hypothetical protein
LSVSLFSTGLIYSTRHNFNRHQIKHSIAVNHVQRPWEGQEIGKKKKMRGEQRKFKTTSVAPHLAGLGETMTKLFCQFLNFDYSTAK